MSSMDQLFEVNPGEKLESVSVWICSLKDCRDFYKIMKHQIRHFGGFALTFSIYEEDL